MSTTGRGHAGPAADPPPGGRLTTAAAAAPRTLHPSPGQRTGAGAADPTRNYSASGHDYLCD